MIWFPSSLREAISWSIACRTDASSRMLPPSLTVNLNRLPLLQSQVFVKTVHQVEILRRLTRGSFDQIVERGKNHSASSPRRQAPGHIAKVRMVYCAQFGEPRRTEDPYKKLGFVTPAVLGLEFFRTNLAVEVHVHRRENPPVYGQKVGHEGKVAQIPT